MASGDNLVVEVFTPGQEVTGRCTALVRGGRFVVPSADITGGWAGTENIRVAEAGAGGHAIGVSRYEGALNEEIPLITNVGSIIPMVAGTGGVTFAQALQAEAGGLPITLAAGVKLGVALSTAAAGAIVLVKLTGI